MWKGKGKWKERNERRGMCGRKEEGTRENETGERKGERKTEKERQKNGKDESGEETREKEMREKGKIWKKERR